MQNECCTQSQRKVAFGSIEVKIKVLYHHTTPDERHLPGKLPPDCVRAAHDLVGGGGAAPAARHGGRGGGGRGGGAGAGRAEAAEDLAGGQSEQEQRDHAARLPREI